MLRCIKCLQFFSLIGLVFVFAVVSYAHEKELSEYNCHEQENEEGEMVCHCHDTNRPNIPLACENDRPVEPVRSVYELRIVDDEECDSRYFSGDFDYGSRLDEQEALQHGGYYSPYEDFCYETRHEVTIEHMVARSEGHISGLCHDSLQKRTEFSNDHLNITPLLGSVNGDKSNHDVAAWLPEHNVCWFVWTVVQVKQKYDLSVDISENNAIKRELAKCSIEDLYLKMPETCKLAEDGIRDGVRTAEEDRVL